MSDEKEGLLQFIGLRSATGLVIASMIGAGIFTTTGFQAADLGHPGYIFALWILGGFLAFCGAVCFGELGAAMPKAGAEYVYIRESYGAALAFMSAFVALFAGFSAPIAGALKSLARYLGHFFPVLSEDPVIAGAVHVNDVVAVVFVWILVAIHARGARAGIGFNDLVTFLKVAGIILILLATVAVGKGELSNLTEVSPVYGELGTFEKFAAFANALIFVTFCYLGWNGSAYVASEMKNPQRDLPRSLLIGTGLVTVLYLGLNAMYFYGSGVEGLAGEVEVGLIAARDLFGDLGVTLVALLLCVSILASASAMTVVGPRVYFAFAGDFRGLEYFHKANPRTGAPVAALVLQGVVTSVIIFGGQVDQIIQYAGFTLTLFASIGVSCVIALRLKQPDLVRPYRAWGYPFTPLFFLGVSLWTMVWAFKGRPIESSLGLVTVVVGGTVFYLVSMRGGSAPKQD